MQQPIDRDMQPQDAADPVPADPADRSARATRGRFVSAARVFTLLTLVSRVFGLIRDKVCAHQFGNGAIWSAFSIGFMVPNLFRRLFGEGALSAAVIPVLTDYEASGDADRREMGRRLISAVVTLLTLLLSGVTLAAEAVLLGLWVGGRLGPTNALVVGLTAVMLPYMVLVCLVALGSAVLNVRGRFAEGAAAPILLNLFLIVAAGVVAPRAAASVHGRIFIVAGSVLAAGVVQWAMVARALRVRGVRLSFRVDWRHPGVRRVATLMAPMVVGLGVVQLNTLADRLIAWVLTARPGQTAYQVLGVTIPRVLDEGAVATLERASRLYEFPLGLFAVAVATAIFPALSRHASEDDLPGLADTLRRGLEIKLLIAAPATVGLLLVRTELVQLIFQGGQFLDRDTARVASVTALYVLGLSAFSAQQLLTRAFYALKMVRTPVRVAAWMVALNLPLNLLLLWAFHRLGGGLSTPDGSGRAWRLDPTGGLALSTTLCAFVQTAWLGAVLRRRIGPMGGRRIARSLAATLAATAVMAVAVWAVRAWTLSVWGGEMGGWASRFAKVLLPVGCGAVVFLAAAMVLRIAAMRDLISREG